MSDLVKRLRETGGGPGFPWTTMQEAAKHIEEQERLLNLYREQNDIKGRLLQRIEALEAALMQIKYLECSCFDEPHLQMMAIAKAALGPEPRSESRPAGS